MANPGGNTRGNTRRNPEMSPLLLENKKGLAEEFTGKLILLLFFLLVAFLIYTLISGKFSHVAGGFEGIS